MTDRSHRPTCRRCDGTGRVDQTYAGGMCFDCSGKGHHASANDKIAALTERLANTERAGRKMAEKIEKFGTNEVRERQIAATRAEYIKVRSDLRALLA